MSRPPRAPAVLTIGPFRGSDAISAGHITMRMLRGASWVRLFPDNYVHRDVKLTHQIWCQAAALLLPPGGAVAGLSAAHLWGVSLLPLGAHDRVSVIVPAGTRIRPHPHLAIRHGTTLGPDDLTTIMGIPLTTPLRTAYDLARLLPRDEAVIALDAFLRKNKLSTAALAAYMAERTSWPGSRRARVALDLTDRAAESPMETRLRLLMHDARLPMPKAQFKIFNGKRFVARVDFAYEEIKLALEYEGDHHRERSAFRFDLERGNELRMLGWTVLRFAADDIQLFPDRVVAQIRQFLLSATRTSRT